MPIIKSAMKRTRQAKKHRAYNVAVKSAVKARIKTTRVQIAAQDFTKAHDSLVSAISELDRAVKKGTLHKRTAARRKSRLTNVYNQAAPAAYGTTAAKTKKPAAKASTTKQTTSKSPAKTSK